MNKELKHIVDQMDVRHRNAYKALDKLAKKMGTKDLYFILKRYYRCSEETAYKPEFPI